MLKINIDKDSIKMSVCGDVITISSEIASIINHIYEFLNSNDKDKACKFKDCIKKIIENDVVFMNDKEREEYTLALKRQVKDMIGDNSFLKTLFDFVKEHQEKKKDRKKVDETEENEEEDVKEILSWLYNPNYVEMKINENFLK